MTLDEAKGAIGKRVMSPAYPAEVGVLVEVREDMLRVQDTAQLRYRAKVMRWGSDKWYSLDLLEVVSE